ncbi:hypothetical protein G7081_07545 [Vagococcus coleopterorum]|uniref:Type VII secretion system protein EssD-like domain-containing protein n=1 Tax=Vagococcus coleopterorum TaxID=2714946 RepID=A0A6G8APN7_9ENTE|nr:DNA/RNA non-specific endonuclease [Vagococcus coleopterorum]QIL46940.1 hypothetical protein G7081_07545 [Vagococcus coleopterorum]
MSQKQSHDQNNKNHQNQTHKNNSTNQNKKQPQSFKRENKNTHNKNHQQQNSSNKSSYKEKFNKYKADPNKKPQSSYNKPNKKKKRFTRKQTQQMGAAAVVVLGMAGSAIYNKVMPGSFNKSPNQHQQQNNHSNKRPNNNNGDYIKRDYNKEQPPFNHDNDGTIMGNNPGETDNGKATFTTDELAFTKTGWIKYGALDRQGRPTTAEAVINKDLVDQKKGSSANRDIRPPGFKTGNEPYGHSRGHLIGKQFGGDGNDKRNLVTMIQEPVNSPLMTDYENYVRWAVSYKRETVRMRVTPVYEGNNPVPTDIQIEAQSMGRDNSINFNVTIPNIK